MSDIYAKRREEGTHCPKRGGDIVEMSEGRCGGCRFYRGGSHGPGRDTPIIVLCNWPHDGSYVEPSFDPQEWERMMAE